MPSNAMKLSQLEAHLAKLRVEHGDLDVVLALARDGALVSIDGRNINVLAQLPWQKLAAPAVVIGLWMDPTGRLQNMPGQKYLSTGDDSGWNFNRAEAPENIDLRVWKRYGGEDWGYRKGEQWFVYEGDRDRPRGAIGIVADGILGWKLP